MTISEIRDMPVCVDEIPAGCRGVHESMLRGYQTLQRVKDWLKRGVPADVILELVADIEATKAPTPAAIDHVTFTAQAGSRGDALQSAIRDAANGQVVLIPGDGLPPGMRWLHRLSSADWDRFREGFPTALHELVALAGRDPTRPHPMPPESIA